MTLCLAMKYDKGVLVMADTESVYFSGRLSDITKLSTFRNNVAFSISGRLSRGQKFMRFMNDVSVHVDNEVRDLSHSSKNEKYNTPQKFLRSLKKDEHDIVVRYRTKNKLGFYLKEKKDQALSNSLQLYSTGDSLESYVNSCADFAGELINKNSMDDISVLFAGIDKLGHFIKLVNSDSGEITTRVEAYYAISGAGSEIATTIMEIFYKETITEDQALLLAFYIGVQCEKLIIGVNKKFTAITIREKENGYIERRVVSARKIDALTKVAENINPDFPFGLAK